MCDIMQFNPDMKELEDRRKAGKNWCHVHDLYHNSKECPLCIINVMMKTIEPFTDFYKKMGWM